MQRAHAQFMRQRWRWRLAGDTLATPDASLPTGNCLTLSLFHSQRTQVTCLLPHGSM